MARDKLPAFNDRVMEWCTSMENKVIPHEETGNWFREQDMATEKSPAKKQVIGFVSKTRLQKSQVYQVVEGEIISDELSTDYSERRKRFRESGEKQTQYIYILGDE